MEIKMEYVESDYLEYIGYDEDSSTLRIQFKGDKTFDYYDFPESEWHELREADSKGKFFHSRIKGQYDYSEV